jgi:hypothetical protein
MPATFRPVRRIAFVLALLPFLLAVRAGAQPSEAFDRLIKLPTGVGDASFFGEVIAKGDVDGDGKDDVAISGRINSGSGDRGQVRILRGAAPHAIVVDRLLIGSPHERSGAALAFGDFDDDGRDELVVARPRRNVAGQTAAGDIGIYRRLPDGSWPQVENWNQESADVSGVPEAEDLFGSALAVGDFDDDGVDDLAIGVPGEGAGGAAAAGAVQILYGIAGQGLSASGNQLFHQDSESVPGGTEEGDRFGEVLAAGDVDCDGVDDLVVGTPAEDVGSTIDVGTVTVLPGRADVGIDPSLAFLLDQQTFGGAAEATDRFGSALVVGRMSNTIGACKTLFIGAPGEDVGEVAGAGAVFLYRNGATDIWTETDMGASENEQNRFGTALAVGDFTGDGLVDVAIGAPGRDFAAGPAHGIVRIVWHRALGELNPSAHKSVRIEAGVEVYDTRVAGEFMDYFGAALAAPDLDDDGLADLVVGMPFSDLDGDTFSGGAEVFFSALFSEDFEGNDVDEWDAVAD